MKTFLFLFLLLGLTACGSTPVKEQGRFVQASMLSIDGEALVENGRFDAPTLIVALDFACDACKEAASRINAWIMPELKGYDFNVLAIASLHDAEDLKLWRDELKLDFDLVADPDNKITQRLDAVGGTPVFKFFNEAGHEVFSYDGWSTDIGRTLLSDLKYVLDSKSPEDKSALIDELYVLSGVELQVKEFPKQIQAQLDEQAAQLPPALYDDLKKNSDSSFHPEAWESTIKSMIASNVSYASLQNIKEWEESKLGKKFAQVELQSYEDGFTEKLLLYADYLEDNKPPAHRMDLVIEIDDLVGGSSMLTEVGLTGVIGFSAVMNALKPKEEQVPFESISAYFMGMVPQVKQKNQAMLTLSMLYLYQTISDAELNEYIKMLETESGREFSQTTMKAFSTVLNKYNAELMSGLGKVLDGYKDLKGV